MGFRPTLSNPLKPFTTYVLVGQDPWSKLLGDRSAWCQYPKEVTTDKDGYFIGLNGAGYVGDAGFWEEVEPKFDDIEWE